MDHFDHLGYYYGEEEIQHLLMELGIVEVPVMEFEWTDAYLSNESLGIELTLSDSESLVSPTRDYPTNALVLSNFRYYGRQIGDFSIYQGVLPHSLTFGRARDDILSMFGEPEWKNPENSRMRWIRDNYRIHMTFDKHGKLAIVSGGLPL
ncbi:hypothetical protein D7T48_13270 [Stenotrophomonas maltophilia]|uniref:hypothetical protein n=1 Tax=Stenotrophomonas TaxID=40323 RepID=UPI0013113684|nr:MULTISPECIES: hypothetical protein [Stenotrophomonas]ELC7323171.1 hypothetical protein [Stenotrophomonas maltophilia]MBA0277756.1 hypothetical protein [Stenotrophomonas maltophilia]MBA0413228.1 hypothetical protein [Stenotrophomonas maltophilia]MBA0498259.1 hypothetical protein [Stenotrophomonas maltophilia]MBA0503041.1 hypothetical protein [Stenotrophomonas maltophilia]